jgi:hypothetical protein
MSSTSPHQRASDVSRRGQVRENHKDGVFVDGLTWLEVESAAACAQLLAKGVRNRHVGETAMNKVALPALREGVGGRMQRGRGSELRTEAVFAEAGA